MDAIFKLVRISWWAELSSASYRDISLRCGEIVLRGGNSEVSMLEKSRRVLPSTSARSPRGTRRALRKSGHCPGTHNQKFANPTRDLSTTLGGRSAGAS